jgi:hypothetical protein
VLSCRGRGSVRIVGRVPTLVPAALIAVVLLASSCVSAEGPASTTVPSASVAAPAPTSSAGGLPAGIKRSTLSLPIGAAFSPDGRYVVYQSSNALVLARADGAIITTTPGSSGPWSWLPDSTGLFIATSAPQRAGPLAILELDGKLTPTELQLASPMLSKDGKTIIAEQQEGCCVSIVQREIRASSRSGGAARVLISSSQPASVTQPVRLLGIDAQDRVLYRDGDRIGLLPLPGGTKEDLAIPAGLVPSLILADSASPDRSVILLRSFDPTAAWMFFKGRLMPFPSEAGTIVRAGAESNRGGASPVWLGPQTILVRSSFGSLGSYDLSLYTPGFGSHALSTILAQFPADTVLAARDGSILWRSGEHVHLLALATRQDRDTGLLLATPNAVAANIASGFLLITESGSYEISAP